MGTLLLMFFGGYIVPCILVGLLGKIIRNLFGFYFWLSIILTPIIGLIGVLYDAFGKHRPQNPNDDFWGNVTGNRLG